MNFNLWLAVITIILTILFGSFSVIVTLIVAVWKVGLRFSGIETRLTRVEAKLDKQNGN